MQENDLDAQFEELSILLERSKKLGSEVYAPIFRIMALLAESEDEFGAPALEEFPQTLYSLLNGSPWRSNEMGSDPITDPRIFEIMYEFTMVEEMIEIALAASPHCPERILWKLAETGSAIWEEDSTQQTIARTTANPEILTYLAESNQNSTRYYVAENPHTPSAVLEKLSYDVDISDSHQYMETFESSAQFHIQFAVVSNEATSKSTLSSIASGERKITPEAFEASHGWKLFDDVEATEINRVIMDVAKAKL